MLKHSYTFLVLFNLLCLVANTHKLIGQELTATSFTFETYKGTIGSYPIHLQVSIEGKNISGTYFYDKTRLPIPINGIVVNNQWELQASPDGKDETFTLNVIGESLKGTWRLKEKNISLPVTMLRSADKKEFKRYVIIDSTFLRDDINPSPTFNFHTELIWPTGISLSDEFIKRSIVNEFFSDEKYRSEIDVVEMLENYKNQLFNNYKNESKDLTKEEITEYFHTLNYEHNLSINIENYLGNLFSISHIEYNFTGGAHGNTLIRYINLDLKNQKQLTLTDIFNPTGIKQIPLLIERQFRKDNKLSPSASLMEAGLFDEHITEVSGTFYLTDKGIGFFYNRYEIAPYAMGFIDVFLPYSALNAYIKPSFMNLLSR